MSGFYHLRLELAREPDHPHGDPASGWDLVCALDENGHLDLSACRADPQRCHIRKFERDVTIATGHLRHTVGDQWIFDLEPGDALDATGFTLARGAYPIAARSTKPSPGHRPAKRLSIFPDRDHAR